MPTLGPHTRPSLGCQRAAVELLLLGPAQGPVDPQILLRLLRLERCDLIAQLLDVLDLLLVVRRRSQPATPQRQASQRKAPGRGSRNICSPHVVREQPLDLGPRLFVARDRHLRGLRQLGALGELIHVLLQRLDLLLRGGSQSLFLLRGILRLRATRLRLWRRLDERRSMLRSVRIWDGSPPHSRTAMRRRRP